MCKRRDSPEIKVAYSVISGFQFRKFLFHKSDSINSGKNGQLKYQPRICIGKINRKGRKVLKYK